MGLARSNFTYCRMLEFLMLYRTKTLREMEENLLNTNNVRGLHHVKMVALPTSLRRGLVMLLVAMSVIVMFFYWNQTPMKPMSQSQINLVMDKIVKISPPEKTWTYRCIANRCVREHFTNDNAFNHQKRIPFLTCTMTCGATPNIWPNPTVKLVGSSKSLTFQSHNIRLKISTKFYDVERLLEDAFNIFLADLKAMESGSALDVEVQKKNGDPNSNSDKNSEQEIEQITHRNRDCDIQNVDVNVAVSRSDVTFVHLDMDESYNLTIKHGGSSARVQINANSFFGARHALASLQQMIWWDDEDELLHILSTAHIVDKPKFRYRGLMLDTSRHYFSIDSIKRTLVGMAHSKLNRFHWHITDSQSFPFQSKYYPELAKYGAYSSHEIYTPEDVKEIADFARVRGIQVIPEIDAPAHAGNGWDWGPKKGLGELSLCINQQPWNYYCGEPPCGQLNPKNNNTFLILQTLYAELLELIGPTDYFHLGGDEVNLECWAQHFNDTDLRLLWCDFMLQAFDRLKKANKNVIPRNVAVWSSGLTSTSCLSKNNFAVQIWGGSTWQENYDLLLGGFNVVFSHVDAWYLDCGFGSWRSSASEGACAPYKTWQKMYNHRPWEHLHVESTRSKQILGGEACMWTEQVDENTLDTRLWPRVGALAERLWTDPPDFHDIELVPKEVFNRMAIYRNRLIELGLKAEPIFPKYCAQNPDECI
ncbi:putative beta-hexosaminidase fdl [Pseudolycoriella hygida]|uniref:beta-N-acetylhexosaminidase n=1 Tax=Pseudolycoriella hygida TaxID=35572 RepID=A0A9Q0MSF3_9DIPT|nr:putative beta-hexosaminidase fdl [Pseudolycoriella hygida]